MTPRRVHDLARRTLGREPTSDELRDWLSTLTCPPQTSCPPVDCVHDDEGDEALRLHRAGSAFPPTLADVRRHTIGLANARVEAARLRQNELDAAQAVPPTPAYLAAKAEWDRQQELRRQQLEGPPETEQERAARRERARAAADAELAVGIPS